MFSQEDPEVTLCTSWCVTSSIWRRFVPSLVLLTLIPWCQPRHVPCKVTAFPFVIIRYLVGRYLGLCPHTVNSSHFRPLVSASVGYLCLYPFLPQWLRNGDFPHHSFGFCSWLSVGRKSFFFSVWPMGCSWPATGADSWIVI